VTDGQSLLEMVENLVRDFHAATFLIDFSAAVLPLGPQIMEGAGNDKIKNVGQAVLGQIEAENDLTATGFVTSEQGITILVLGALQGPFGFTDGGRQVEQFGPYQLVVTVTEEGDDRIKRDATVAAGGSFETHMALITPAFDGGLADTEGLGYFSSGKDIS